jgi:protocatechuate 4,5-dioxygenase alpha chain
MAGIGPSAVGNGPWPTVPISAKEQCMNKGYNEAFKDIPGTVVFDGEQSRLGFHLNQFCMSLMKAENRAAFKADETAYLQGFPMTQAQRDAVQARDYNRMISLGGNIYFLAKIGATDGFSFQNLASKMTGMVEEDYRNMMIAGGRSADGNRSKSEGKN